MNSTSNVDSAVDVDEVFPTQILSNTAKVYLEYDMENPPPLPSDAYTRFVCISDTHARTFQVPPGDVLLHSGDLSDIGTPDEFRVIMDWICGLPHPIKILIAGNHDITLHTSWYDDQWRRFHSSKRAIEPIREYLTGTKARKAGVVYLENQSYEFQAKRGGRKWTVYGSPWSPLFHNWAFNYNRGLEADKLISQFPKTDILLTHCPPRNIMDKIMYGGPNIGCDALATRLPFLRPRLHVFGHIHEAHGAIIKQWDPDSSDSTVFVNAANYPIGPRATMITPGYGSDGMGRTPFQPVIVDLKDCHSPSLSSRIL